MPPSLPPLPDEKRHLYDYYRIAWLPDGYPGRQDADEIVPHPIYGPYVIHDYLALYRKTGSQVYLDGAKTVAHAGHRRMQRFKGGLVFWYGPEMGLIKTDTPVYSALTQARWLNVLTALCDLSGQARYREAAAAVFESLRIPLDEGGVAKRVAGGIAIEERPSTIPAYILNGWITAILAVERFARWSGQEAARTLFDENIRALRALLPLYDIPELLNSRYQLAGAAKFRIGFERDWPRIFADAGARVEDACMHIPGEGVFGFTRRQGSRWVNHFLKSSGGSVEKLNAVMSYVAHPQPNVLELTVSLARSARCTVDIGTGEYDPLAARLRPTDWHRLETVKLPAGRHRVNVEIPWDAAWLVPYPTNFKKRINGLYWNSYHFMHIKGLRSLARVVDAPEFTRYADLWEDYVARWPSHRAYQRDDVALSHHNA